MNYNDKNSALQPQAPSALTTAKPEQGGNARSALGTYAKSSAINNEQSLVFKGLGLKSAHTPYTHVDSETGESTPFKKNKFGLLVENVSTDKIVTERYLLQATARKLMPFSRTAKCNRLTHGCPVSLLKSIEFNSVSFSGLQTCGSPWSCPVCSSKISERRKNEVVSALEQHTKSGGLSYFVTFTFSHSKNECLKTLREQQKQAFIILRKSYGYRKYKEIVGYSGLIRALEVTWGISNGWHPHTHEIVFADKKVSFQSIKRLLFPEWKKACLKAGLSAPSFRRGVDVQGGDNAGAYISKYGDELTKGHMKKATGDRFSPFDLLRSYFYEEEKLHGAKFVEFAEGMQGSRQLYWTNGLKDKFGILDKNDDLVASEQDDYAYLLGEIPVLVWRSVVKYEARASLKIIARDHGFKAAYAFVTSLFDKYQSSGDMKKDDDRIAKNREKYSRLPADNEERLHKLDTSKRDFFDKLNENIDRQKELDNLVSPELIALTSSINEKYYKRDKQREFFDDNYFNKVRGSQFFKDKFTKQVRN